MSKSLIFPHRGEIYWVNIEESDGSDLKPKPQGAESQKNRPGVIISNNKQNEFSGAIIIALITSQVDKIYPFEVAIEINGKLGKILTDQIYTIDKSRLGKKKIGTITDKQFWQLSKGLHMVLELKDC